MVGEISRSLGVLRGVNRVVGVVEQYVVFLRFSFFKKEEKKKKRRNKDETKNKCRVCIDLFHYLAF